MLKSAGLWSKTSVKGGWYGRRETMSEAELLALRTVLANRRCALLDRLATDAAGRKDHPEHLIEPGFLCLLADTHTAIAAVDAALAESITAGGEQ
jgi:hypothetical protein